MSIALLCACALVVIAVLLVALVTVVRANRDPDTVVVDLGPLAARQRQTVLVSLIGGDAYRGALWESSAEGLVLKSVEFMADGNSRRVDGEVFIPAGRVDIVQFVAGT